MLPSGKDNRSPCWCLGQRSIVRMYLVRDPYLECGDWIVTAFILVLSDTFVTSLVIGVSPRPVYWYRDEQGRRLPGRVLARDCSQYHFFNHRNNRLVATLWRFTYSQERFFSRNVLISCSNILCHTSCELAYLLC